MTTSNKRLSYEIPVKNTWFHTLTKPNQSFETSAHFRNGRFHNEHAPDIKHSSIKVLQWLMSRKNKSWKVDVKKEYEAFFEQDHETPTTLPHHDGEQPQWRIWFIGHATVLIQIGMYNFLTDPMWSDYAGPKSGTGPRRVCPAGVALESLPEIHGVLLSHNHYDHMDLATLEWLDDTFKMPIYTGLGNSHYLPSHFNVIELDWWQSALFKDFEIVYTPAQHGSGRGIRDQNCALWGGFCLKKDDQYVYFAGDTGYSPHFKEIYAKFGAPRVALLPIGSYAPRKIMKYMHMDPDDALKAHMDLQSHRSVALHYRTFQLTDEARFAPENVLEESMSQASKLMNPFYCIHEGKKLIV